MSQVVHSEELEALDDGLGSPRLHVENKSLAMVTNHEQKFLPELMESYAALEEYLSSQHRFFDQWLRKHGEYPDEMGPREVGLKCASEVRLFLVPLLKQFKPFLAKTMAYKQWRTDLQARWERQNKLEVYTAVQFTQGGFQGRRQAPQAP